jgi:hypothetical protein
MFYKTNYAKREPINELSVNKIPHFIKLSQLISSHNYLDEVLILPVTQIKPHLLRLMKNQVSEKS